MIIIGITGGSGSGKTRFTEALTDALNPSLCAHIPEDAYYIDRSNIPLKERKNINFDIPSAIDVSLLYDHLFSLKRGIPIERPQYSFVTCTRSTTTVQVEPQVYLLVEGLFILNDARIRQLLHLKVFLDVPYHQRFIRTRNRDIRERGRTAAEVKKRFENVVEPMHKMFVDPGRQFADIILQNQVIELGIKTVLQRLDGIK